MTETLRNTRAEYPEGIDYYDPSNRACDTMATAFLMYRIGASEEVWQPEAIDRISGRNPNMPTEPVQIFNNLLALLEQGAEIIELCPFDSSRLIAEGLSYLEEFYKDDAWLLEDAEDFYSYWKENLDEFIAAYIAFNARITGEFSDRYHSTLDTATIDDVRELLSQGYTVKCMQTSNIDSSFVHAIVVTEIKEYNHGTGVSIFDPNVAHKAGLNGPIILNDEDHFIENWKPTEGCFAIRRAGN